MGFRTVVVLNNDMSHEWKSDPKLGQMIFHAAAAKEWHKDERSAHLALPYGEIVEQVHADTQTVAFLDGYGGKAVAYTHWHAGQIEEQKDIEMLKALADKLGYRISAKAKVVRRK